MPYLIPGLAACTAIDASDVHACAICGGDVYCWGDNFRGGVGGGPRQLIPTPRKLDVALDAADAWVQLVSGVAFTCARTRQGHAYCWGLGIHGALGVGGRSANTPVTPTR